MNAPPLLVYIEPKEGRYHLYRGKVRVLKTVLVEGTHMTPEDVERFRVNPGALLPPQAA